MGALQHIKEPGVYVILNVISKKCYVGSALSLSWRLYQHKNRLSQGKHYNHHLQRAWKLYGESSFEFKVVARCPASHRVALESLLIKSFDSMNPERGYNLREPDTLLMSPETRQKMSLMNFGKKHTRRSSPRKHTAKSLELMSRKQTGENNGRCKITDAQVVEIRLRISNGEKHASIAKAYGLSEGYITFIRYGWSRGNKTQSEYKTLGPVVRQNKIALTGQHIAELAYPSIFKCEGM